MPIVDTHTHLYLEEFHSDIDSVMERAVQSGVQYFILPNIDCTSLQPMTDLKNKYPRHCRLMFGLHPCSVKDNWKEELHDIFAFAEKHPHIGIGEIGLDFYWDTTHKKEQFQALEHQLKIAVERNLPVSLHTRNAIDETIEMVQSFPGLKGVFHCFTGTSEQAKRIVQLENFYFGIGGVVTFKNSELKKVLKEIPLEKIVVETDAPYLAPVPHRGKRNEPFHLTYIIKALSEVYEREENVMINQLFNNSHQIFLVDNQHVNPN
jgi:TatD DNase family protein